MTLLDDPTMRHGWKEFEGIWHYTLHGMRLLCNPRLACLPIDTPRDEPGEPACADCSTRYELRKTAKGMITAAVLDGFIETQKQAAMRIELDWWRELASRLVPGGDLPKVGGDLGPYRYRISRAGYIEEKP